MNLLDLAFEDGRKWTRVGERFAVTKRSRKRDLKGLGSISYFPMDVIPQDGSYEPTSFTAKSAHEISSGTYFERGDVLVAKITPSFENGKQALIRSLEADFGFATTEVIPLHALSPESDARLLFFYLLHPDIRHFIAERMEGSTGRQRVPENLLLDLPMPDLKPSAQKRAADALELIQSAVAVEAKIVATAREAKTAAMRQLFSRGLRGEAQKESEVAPIPTGWELATIDQHFSVVSGGTPSRGNDSYWAGGTIPWVKTTEVKYSVITEAEEHITQAGLDGSAAKMLQPGTLLMAMYGQGVTRGKVGILGIEASCNQACAAMTPTDDAVLPQYLYHFLTSRYEAIRSLAHGGQQQNLNLDIVRRINVPVPSSTDEQQEIVDVLDALDRKIDLHRHKGEVLDQLFKSLLHKLMTGEVSVAELDLSVLPERERSAA